MKKLSGDFLSGPILPALIRFSLPLMLSLLLQALYGGVDLAVVGQFAMSESVSAVSTGSQAMQAVTALIAGLTMGVTVLLGKAIGAGNLNYAGQVAAGQIKLYLSTAAILTVIMLPAAPCIAGFLNVPQAAYTETVEYVRICSAGIIFITAYNGISGIFRGIGNSRSPFLFVLIACMINILLDLVFVGVCKMGAAGAALATVMSQAASVIFSVCYIRRHPLPFTIPQLRNAKSGTIKKILQIGSPIALQDFLTTLSFLIITAIINTLGVTASAGVGISEKLFVFFSIVPMSFMSALSTFVAQNMGAGDQKRANRALFLAQRISFCCGLLMFLMTFFAGDLLVSLFTGDPDVIDAAVLYLRGSSPEYLLVSVSFCFLGYFNGREHTAFVMAQGLLAAFFIRIPLSYLLSRLPDTGLFLISLAVPASALFTLALCIGYYILLRRRDRKAQNGPMPTS